jgi:transcriptional regulator GlxA family with amidase domain
MAIELIEREHGRALAVRVGEWFIRAEPRAGDGPQRASLRERYGVANDRVLKVLAHMETSVEDPAPRRALAALAGVSVRQLERLFAASLNCTLNGAYLSIRLAQADRLLRQTGLPVTQVAVACGFQSPSHFSRAFRGQYGTAPRGWREAVG